METNIYKEQRVLYKINGDWKVGTLMRAVLNPGGLWFDIEGIDGQWASVAMDKIFFNARKLEEWEKDPADGTLIPKEEFIDDLENDRVDESDGTAFVSDGEYQYYNIPKLRSNWIRKQPFDYVVWVN